MSKGVWRFSVGFRFRGQYATISSWRHSSFF